MTEYTDKKDETLVELTLLGNERAYEELVVRHERAVKGTAYKVTNNEFSAEDASQDAFVSAWMNLDSLRDRAKFGSWVCSIAKNHARSIVESYKSRISDISYTVIENIADSDESGLLQELGVTNISEWERDEKLHRSVEALGEKIKETVKLHYFDGLSVVQIAKRLSVPEGTVKWRLCEGRKQLRKEYGVMEKTYNENESLVKRVMRQVEELKLWRLKDDKTGFETDYKAVLAAVEALDESSEKQHALADVLMHGYWWLPGERNKDMLSRIKQAAIMSHNEEVMESIVGYEHDEISNRDEKIKFMLETQIPELEKTGFIRALGYVWFWLGNKYFDKGDYEKCLEANEKVLEILSPDCVYYANAKSVITILHSYQPSKRNQISATGEVYRYIGDKLYFWTQPGFSRGPAIIREEALFWACSRCDSLIFDPAMNIGDSIEASDKKSKLTVTEKDATIETPAGVFENCTVTVFEGNRYGLKYAKTYFCPGVGIVAQIVDRADRKCIWKLSKYQINGGDGIIPFYEGNKWEYTCDDQNENLFEIESVSNIFEVTAFENGKATVSSSFLAVSGKYKDTWRGNYMDARDNYHSNNDELTDVSDKLKRAAMLAETKRQKLQTEIATDVMNRIFDTDPDYNPNYTEKGMWNFFNIDCIEKSNGKIFFESPSFEEHFEWKDISKTGFEGYKLLHNFLYDILCDAAGCVWSDEWVPGYHVKKEINTRSEKTVLNLDVLDDETVITPAGAFENCRHVYFDLQGKTGGWIYRGGKKHYWFAPGVGIVKMMALPHWNEELEAVWELTEYKGGGEGYFPVADGLFRRYESKDMKDGFYGAVEYTFDEDELGTVIFRNATGTQKRADYEASEKYKLQTK